MISNLYNSPAPPGTYPESSKPFLNRYKPLWLAKGAAVIGGLALGGSVGSFGPSPTAEAAALRPELAPAMPYVGFSSNEIFVEDRNQAEEAADAMQKSGANSVRIFMPYTKGGAEIKNDKLKLCNAAHAAQDHGMKLIISFNGYSYNERKRGMETGYVPDRSEVTKFITTLDTIMWTLAKDPEPGGQNGGCVPEQKNINFEPFNEINNPTFNKQQDPKTAERYMRMLSKIMPQIKKEASKPGLGVNVKLFAGALAASHDAPGFAKEMGQAMNDLHLKSVPFDVLTAHPYAPTPDSDPTPTAEYLYASLKPIVDKYFPGKPLLWDEVGVNSDRVGEAKQAQYYQNFYVTAACQKGVIGGMTFQLTDDGQSWTSGIRHSSGAPKSSFQALTATQTAAAAGNLTFCNK